jgi:predicted deacetylase
MIDAHSKKKSLSPQRFNLVVSLHDVSPQTEKIVTQQLEELRALGVSRCSLLVIPDHHHLGMITRFPSFIRWLQTQAAHGHEIILHGFNHLRGPRKHQHPWKRLIAEHYTAGEGEFYDLNYEEAYLLLEQGKKVFQDADLDFSKIVGFIAPAWLLSQAAEEAVADQGFSYTTRLHGVVNLQEKPHRFFPSQSMVYSVRSAWRRAASLAWNESLLLYATERKWPLLRIGFHPVDWKYQGIKDHLLSSVQCSLRTRTPVTYQEWLAQIFHTDSCKEAAKPDGYPG